MIRLFQAFVRLTGFLPAFVCFRTKVSYEDRSAQGRHISGPAIIVSNHTSVYDYAVMLFVFLTRTLRYQMAEVVLDKKVLGPFLRLMGGIRIDRRAHEFSFMDESLSVLRQGGVVGIFPEGRLPLKGETPPNPFLPGAAMLSLTSGVKVIPVWTNGSYFCLKRARVVIGRPMDPEDYAGPGLTEKERLLRYSAAMRERVVRLKELADG